MKTFSLFFVLALSLSLLSVNAQAKCRTKTIVYYPSVVYATPVAYQVYAACPCSGTWGSPTCNCPDVYVQTTGCSSCAVQRERHMIPGHWHGTEYEVYYDTPSVYPTPTYYEGKDLGYAIDQY